MKLDEFRKLMEAATPGPWFDIKGAGYRGVFTVDEYSKADRLDQRICDVYHRNAESAAFIAAMRTLAPKMLAVCEAIKAYKENLIGEFNRDGVFIHQFYTAAPCEYGEAIDDALAALEEETP